MPAAAASALLLAVAVLVLVLVPLLLLLVLKKEVRIGRMIIGYSDNWINCSSSKQNLRKLCHFNSTN